MGVPPELTGINVPFMLFAFLIIQKLAPKIWTYLADQGLSDFQVVFVGFYLWTFIFYLAYSSVLAILDLFGNYSSLWKYKIQDEKQATLKDYQKVTAHFLIVSVYFHLPAHYGYYYYLRHACNRTDLLHEPFPSFPILLRDFLVFVAIEEIGFYYGHRLMHSKFLYQRVHKTHHEFSSPFGMAGVYAHPVEHLVVNVIPLALGGIIMESHPLVFAIWITAAIFTVITTHSGFKFPGLPNPVPHDYHHQVLNANYGVLGILDTLHGTRGRFQQYLMKVTKNE